MTHNCVASTIFEGLHRGLAMEYLQDACGALPYANAAGRATVGARAGVHLRDVERVVGRLHQRVVEAVEHLRRHAEVRLDRRIPAQVLHRVEVVVDGRDANVGDIEQQAAIRLGRAQDWAELDRTNPFDFSAIDDLLTKTSNDLLDAGEVSSNAIASAYKELRELDRLIRQADREAAEVASEATQSNVDDRFDASAI